ncbi:MAG: discoidin domain-containing protein, partial [Candidatus Sericytochromatia bacterium]
MASIRRVTAPMSIAILSLAVAACQNTISIVSTGQPQLPGEAASGAEPGTSEPSSDPVEAPLTVPVVIVDVSKQPEADPGEGGGSSGGSGGGSDQPAASTPPTDPLPPLAIVGVEANYTHPGYGAERALDGNRNTEWATGQTAGGILTLSFNQEAAIAGVGLKTGPTPAGAQIHIETSVDGTNWQLARSVANATWDVETHPISGGPVARYVRLRYDEGSSGKPGFAVFELNVQAVPAGEASPATPLPGASLAPVSGTTIYVEPDSVLHRAESRLLGTNRNHAVNDFPNGAAKLQKLKALQPQWGDGKYLYRIGHGPTDGRHDYDYMTGFHFEQSWGKTGYPYDDIREGLKDAAAI